MKSRISLFALLLLVGGILVPNQIAGTAAAPDPIAEEVTLAYADPIIVLEDAAPKVYARPSPSPNPRIDDGSLRVGSRGPEVQALEEKLASLSYMVGKVDGVFDNATRHGVMAFQKVEGLRRTGTGTGETIGRAQTAVTPRPAYLGPAYHVELDIPRQVVFVVTDGKVTAILSTSTGNNKNFTSQGWTRKAVTPNGQFKVTRKINGMRISPLGALYKPLYFNGGIALHGSPSVPAYPASHGCARLPMMFADWFFSAIPIGTVVYVFGGPTGPHPQPYIDDRPAEEPTPSPSPSPSPEPSPSPSPTSTVTDTVTD